MTSSAVHHFTVHHDGVAISASCGGRGRPLVLCPGLSSTQAGLQELIELLRCDHDVVTFDLSGHGSTSAAEQYSFAAFLGDLTAVIAELEALGLSAAPVLAGYSLGADLAVQYAADHPGAVAGLVLIDGGNPVPEPFIPAADVPDFLAMWESSVAPPGSGAADDAARRVRLTAREILELNLELDVLRTGTLLGLYHDVTAPISMIMSTSMAGTGIDGATQGRNRNWRAGIERLVRTHPQIAAIWLEADHQLVVTHAPEIARIVTDLTGLLPGRPPGQGH
ncbi:alpha/beta fold hydrolase [Nocardia sp. NPDC051750]|uniref:alpha/beta fold hydrolase n=1 Tax=Nocardia sp. NPDC051750 TaxID=3364325 RepID=UPI00379B4473